MDKLRINGGRRLSGSVRVGGAKNAALPALAACLLSDEEVVLRNVPGVRDVRTMMQVLEQLGATVSGEGDRVSVCAERIASFEAPYELVKTMRASILVLGPLLARNGRARVSLPGGCAIGERPINYHIDALEQMGAEITLEHGYVEAKADRLEGAQIAFPNRSVTGTENLMMAATLARGTTVLSNCALEPEIVDLADLLSAMGARIEGAGTGQIVIEGRERLTAADHNVIPDRIEAGTYLVAGALIGDEVELTGCRPDHLDPVLLQLRSAGVEVEVGTDTLRVSAPGRIEGRDLRTSPHPGYPTDMQAQYMALMTQAAGPAVIAETIFEHRFMHVSELLRMGANIRVDGHTCVVVGPTPLTGAQVMATDLRASACLVLAGLVASGTTVVHRVYHLDRGYEAMERKLQALGADVEDPMTESKTETNTLNSSAEDCLFCKILAGKIPSDKVYEDEHVYAFRDIHPQAPVHVLVIPRRHLPSLDAADKNDAELLGRVLLAVQKVANAEGVSGGYRVVNNCGESAGQSVFHVHFHLLAGRGLGWPPG